MDADTRLKLRNVPPKTRSRRACIIPAALLALVVIAFVAAVALSSPFNPVRSVISTAGYALAGRLHFPQDRLGQVVEDEEGRDFIVFREVVVDPASNQPSRPGAMIFLKFRAANLREETNQFLSLLPLPFYIGNPGFRSTLFTINGELCQAIYSWDTYSDAANFASSPAFTIIQARAVSGSFTYEIRSLETE